MIRTVFAMAVAAFLLAVASGTSQAAPIAPLGAAVTTDHAGVTQVYWRGRYWGRPFWGRPYWGRPYWGRPFWGHPYWGRRCWRGPYGGLHCRW